MKAEFLKILEIEPSLQRMPDGGYYMDVVKDKQLKELEALFALRIVSQQRELLKFLINRDYLEGDKEWIEQLLAEYHFEKLL